MSGLKTACLGMVISVVTVCMFDSVVTVCMFDSVVTLYMIVPVVTVVVGKGSFCGTFLRHFCQG